MARTDREGDPILNDPLTPRDVGRILQVARGRRHVHADRDHALLLLLAESGCRVSEGIELRPSDFRWKEGSVIVHRRKVRRGKPEQRVYLGRRAILALRAYIRRNRIPEDGYCFPALEFFKPSENRERHISVRMAQHIWHRTLREAGTERRRLHELRHAAGIRLWNGTHDLVFVARQLGHRDPREAMRYMNHDGEHNRNLADRAAL